MTEERTTTPAPEAQNFQAPPDDQGKGKKGKALSPGAKALLDALDLSGKDNQAWAEQAAQYVADHSNQGEGHADLTAKQLHRHRHLFLVEWGMDDSPHWGAWSEMDEHMQGKFYSALAACRYAQKGR